MLASPYISSQYLSDIRLEAPALRMRERMKALWKRSAWNPWFRVQGPYTPYPGSIISTNPTLTPAVALAFCNSCYRFRQPAARFGKILQYLESIALLRMCYLATQTLHEANVCGTAAATTTSSSSNTSSFYYCYCLPLLPLHATTTTRRKTTMVSIPAITIASSTATPSCRQLIIRDDNSNPNVKALRGVGLFITGLRYCC